MGMYTELVLGIELYKGTPQEVIDILKYMTGEDDLNLLHKDVLESHPFFSCDRWKYLFTMGSYYFDGQTHSELKYDDISKTYFLTTRSNLKNYNSEIDMFLDWIEPYVNTRDMWGYKRYEESEMPTIIFKDEKYKLKLLDVGDTLDKAYDINIKEDIKYNISKWNSKEENQKWEDWLNKLE